MAIKFVFARIAYDREPTEQCMWHARVSSTVSGSSEVALLFPLPQHEKLSRNNPLKEGIVKPTDYPFFACRSEDEATAGGSLTRTPRRGNSDAVTERAPSAQNKDDGRRLDSFGLGGNSAHGDAAASGCIIAAAGLIVVALKSFGT